MRSSRDTSSGERSVGFMSSTASRILSYADGKPRSNSMAAISSLMVKPPSFSRVINPSFFAIYRSIFISPDNRTSANFSRSSASSAMESTSYFNLIALNISVPFS